MSTSTSTSYDQNVQDAQVAMQEQYEQLESWIDEIAADNEDIEEQSQDLETQQGWWIFGHTVVNETAMDQIEADQADIEQMNANIAAAEAGNSSFTDLTDSIDDCMDAMTTAENSVTDEDDIEDCDLLIEDLQVICATMDDLVAALNEQVVIQEDADEMEYLQENGGSSAQMSAVAQKSISDQGTQANILNDMRTYLNTTTETYNQQYNDADADENGIYWWNNWFGYGYERQAEDEAIKANSLNMIELAQEINTNTAPLLAAYTPDLMQISAMLDEIMKKLAELLNANLNKTPEEQQESVMALNKMIMEIFVVVIGMLSLVQQDATTDKAENDAKMSEATNEAAEMGMVNSQAEMRKIAENLAYAAIMGIIMKVAEYSMQAIALLVAPGIGGLIVSAILIALQDSGVMNMLIAKLSEVMGPLAAAGLVTALEIAATMGGGAALDAAMNSAMEQIGAATIEKFSTTAIQDAVESGTTQVADALGEEAAQMAKPAIEQAAKEGAEQASKKVFTAYFKQNGLGLAIEWMKEAAVGEISTATDRMVQEVVETAVKEAAQTAAARASDIIIIAGKVDGVVADQILSQISKAAIEAGDAAAASAMKMSAEDMAKVTLDETMSDSALTAATRGGFAGLYGMGANNMLIDMLKAATKNSDKEFATLTTVLEVLQALLMMIGQLGGTGVGQGTDITTAGRTFTQIANGVMPLDLLAKGAADASQYGIDKKEATALTEMGMIQTSLDILLQVLEPQIQSRQKQEAQHDNAVFMQEMRSNVNVSNHLYDYFNVSAGVIAG